MQKLEETGISLAVTVANAKLVDTAFVNHIPVKPKTNYLVRSNLCWTTIPIVLIYILGLLDTKIHTRKDIENVVKAPILGDIPLGDENLQLVVELDKRSNLAEAFRLVRTNLDFMLSAKTSGEAKIIGVTSTMAGEENLCFSQPCKYLSFIGQKFY